jgi:protein TonB
MMMTATKSGTDGRRLLWALAVSALAHACAGGALFMMPVGTPGDRPAADNLSKTPVLRPVQVALVASPHPRREKPPSRAAAPESASRPLFESAIAKAETRVLETEPPPAAVKPPASERPKAPQVTAAPAVVARPVQEARPAASAKDAFVESGPVADAGATRQEAGGGGIPGGNAGGGSGGGSGEAAAGQDAGATAKAATPVEIVNLPTPEYPPRSRRLGEEGRVLLEVEVLADGRAGKIRMLQAPDFPRLVEAAIEAAKNARFRPATRDGQPVCAVVEIAIRFRLD